jgi:hypothetical protein
MRAGCSSQSSLVFFVWVIIKDSLKYMIKGPCRRAERSFQKILATVYGEVTIMIFLPDDKGMPAREQMLLLVSLIMIFLPYDEKMPA